MDVPAFDEPTLTQLLGSIEAGRLVILCGAGLSIPPPSSLWSAQRVARACYDRWLATERLPPGMRDDIDQLAGHFYANGLFETAFLGALVPWDDLVGQPNAGHAAVADLLISRAAHATLSSNFDMLIEQWANAHKVAMRGALDGPEAVSFSDTSNPLLKFHGCLNRSRERTLRLMHLMSRLKTLKHDWLREGDGWKKPRVSSDRLGPPWPAWKSLLRS
jgi:hypothetical protein